MDSLLPTGKIRDIAEKHSDEIMFELGIKETDSSYGMLHYELVFHMYHKINKVNEIINNAKILDNGTDELKDVDSRP